MRKIASFPTGTIDQVDTAPKVQVPRVARTSLVDEVIAVIKKMLAEDAWAAGTKLPSEIELGRLLGVGRSTVREALRVLGHLGVVEARSGSGTYVTGAEVWQRDLLTPTSKKTRAEFLEFRKLIEIPASGFAAERHSQAEMDAIMSAWQRCMEDVQDSDEMAKLDYDFHLSIVTASHNAYLTKAFATHANDFIVHVGAVLKLGLLSGMLPFHSGLVDAIKRRDKPAAVKATVQNLREIEVRVELIDRRAQNNLASGLADSEPNAPAKKRGNGRQRHKAKRKIALREAAVRKTVM
ncbi:FadR/GntR family transcriptional regulator [Bradyrhizobium sp. dw_78]|uniref:FadR/GntR family transcriptional regulator n=1 Tax=Bradyrhizobium sp. dw_78 TaxID=2719793 RepID=UPI001BD1CCAE